MSQARSLKRLESLLETFIEQVVATKEERLSVLRGLNRLDDLTRESDQGLDITESIGEWFAEHNRWLNEPQLRAGDVSRIAPMLVRIRESLDNRGEQSAASMKIRSEISRWEPRAQAARQKLVLKRGSETAEPKPEPQAKPEVKATVEQEPDEDSIARLDNVLERMHQIFKGVAHGRKHVLSALDSALRSATVQRQKEALLLSGFIIYYLKQNGYKVEPYVKRLKEAERLIREEA
ncbi:hypothetical protein GF356_13515 [candidate division GN15 bacterium]|nr:hypothetical protein [candidate division GN15 bacterium]